MNQPSYNLTPKNTPDVRVNFNHDSLSSPRAVERLTQDVLQTYLETETNPEIIQATQASPDIEELSAEAAVKAVAPEHIKTVEEAVNILNRSGHSIMETRWNVLKSDPDLAA